VLSKTVETEYFFKPFKRHVGIDADYVVGSFGDSPALADELLALVVAGTKRATASLRRNYGDGREPLPSVEDYVVVLAGNGVPSLICQTTDIEVKPLSAVDDQFAWDEGEGDRTRAGWLANHRHYFAREAERDGFAMHDDILVVFERFRVVWPLAIADRPPG
jgi:uncharacterized protein YhfF